MILSYTSIRKHLKEMNLDPHLVNMGDRVEHETTIETSQLSSMLSLGPPLFSYAFCSVATILASTLCFSTT